MSISLETLKKSSPLPPRDLIYGVQGIGKSTLASLMPEPVFLAAEDGRAISMKHIIHAVKREFQKMGKLCMEEDFGKYYHLLTEEA